MKSRTRAFLQFHWGFLGPGTAERFRHRMGPDYLNFLRARPDDINRHLLFCQTGWGLDDSMSPEVLDISAANPQPLRAVGPLSPIESAELRRQVRRGRLEPVLHTYTPQVAEACSGEGLMRSLELSLAIHQRVLGSKPRVLAIHDLLHGMLWGVAQAPQIAKLLGVRFILTTVGGTLTGLDGTTIQVFGPPFDLAPLSQDRGSDVPVFWPSEMPNGITQSDPVRGLVSYFRQHYPHLRHLRLRAVRLDAYLRKMPGQHYRADTVGTTGWFGGLMDGVILMQTAKSLELQLPALEALASLAPAANDRKQHQRKIENLWKQTFIFQDGHVHWLMQDYKRWFLPQSKRFLERTDSLKRQLMEAVSVRPDDPSRCAIFNPVPWRRRRVVADDADGNPVYAERLPAWGVAKARPARIPSGRRVTSSGHRLSNALVEITFGADGMVRRWRDRQTRGLAADFASGGGQLINVVERAPRVRRQRMRYGEAVLFEGAAVARSRVRLSKPVAEATPLKITLRLPRGCCHRIVVTSFPGGQKQVTELLQSRIPLRRPGDSFTLTSQFLGMLATGTRELAIDLELLSEGRIELEYVGLEFSERYLKNWSWLALSDWELIRCYEIEYAPGRVRSLETTSASNLRHTVVVTGELPQCAYRQEWTLRADSRVLERRLQLRFDRSTWVGLSTPSLKKRDGSHLCAGWEAPYVPGLLLRWPLQPMPPSAPVTYWSDNPFLIRQQPRMPDETPRNSCVWRGGHYWLGIDPILAGHLAFAERSDWQLGWFTRGLQHFFRWRRPEGEYLGLSLGTSLFSSVLFEREPKSLARCEFLRAKGVYEYHDAFSLAWPGEGARIELWKRGQEFAVPPFVQPGRPKAQLDGCDMITSDNPVVIVTGLRERRGRWIARVCNYSSRPQRTVLRAGEKAVPMSLPPHAVREQPIHPGTLPREIRKR